MKVRPAALALVLAALAVAAGCGGDDDGATPMQATDAAPYVKMEAIGLRGDPPTMRFVRDDRTQDMSLSEDGLVVWSVTDGVPVRWTRNRPECRYPAVPPDEFAAIASQVLWSATPPADFPDTGTWGFLGSRRDADAGRYDGRTWRYASDGDVVLTLDAKDRPVSATTARGPFTLSFGPWEAASVRDAAGLPACG